jgi:galactonate dehydratase
MPAIRELEYFRLRPRWLFVKITDEEGRVGWGEASLEGHTQAVEGCLDAYRERILGLDAEYVLLFIYDSFLFVFLLSKF